MFFGLIAGFVVLFIIFLVGGIWFIAGKEGRFHIRRFISRGGIDLLKYRPLSKQLSMSKIKWDGKYWVEGKDAIMVGIDQQKEVSTTSERYNAAVSASGSWEGSRRPVLIATEEMFFVFSHGFLELLRKAARLQKYVQRNKKDRNPKAGAVAEMNAELKQFTDELESIKTLVQEDEKYKNVKSFLTDLLSQVQLGYKGTKIITTLTADEVTKFLEGATPRILQEARLEGKVEGGLEMTKPDKKEGIPPMVKALAISASVIMALIIAYVVITGSNPLEGIKDVIPS